MTATYQPSSAPLWEPSPEAAAAIVADHLGRTTSAVWTAHLVRHGAIVERQVRHEGEVLRRWAIAWTAVAELPALEGRARIVAGDVEGARFRAGRALLRASGYTNEGGAIFSPEGRCLAASRAGGWGPFVERMAGRMRGEVAGSSVTARWA
jgi:hypothetical protein